MQKKLEKQMSMPARRCHRSSINRFTKEDHFMITKKVKTKGEIANIRYAGQSLAYNFSISRATTCQRMNSYHARYFCKKETRDRFKKAGPK